MLSAHHNFLCSFLNMIDYFLIHLKCLDLCLNRRTDSAIIVSIQNSPRNKMEVLFLLIGLFNRTIIY